MEEGLVHAGSDVLPVTRGHFSGLALFDRVDQLAVQGGGVPAVFIGLDQCPDIIVHGSKPGCRSLRLGRFARLEVQCDLKHCHNEILASTEGRTQA